MLDAQLVVNARFHLQCEVGSMRLLEALCERESFSTKLEHRLGKVQSQSRPESLDSVV
jgi:hypothetical protein